MTTNDESRRDIPEEIALKVCREIRQEKKVRLLSQCMGCLKFSKGDPKKMYIFHSPGNRGCELVNTRYDEMIDSD